MNTFISPYMIPNKSKYSTTSTSWQHKHSTFLPIAPHLPDLYHSVTLWFFIDFHAYLDIDFFSAQISFTIKLSRIQSIFEQRTFRSKLKKMKKIHPKRSSLYFRKWNLLALILKNFKEQNPPKKKFLIFQKMELVCSNIK